MYFLHGNDRMLCDHLYFLRCKGVAHSGDKACQKTGSIHSAHDCNPGNRICLVFKRYYRRIRHHEHCISDQCYSAGSFHFPLPFVRSAYPCQGKSAERLPGRPDSAGQPQYGHLFQLPCQGNLSGIKRRGLPGSDRASGCLYESGREAFL